MSDEGKPPNESAMCVCGRMRFHHFPDSDAPPDAGDASIIFPCGLLRSKFRAAPEILFYFEYGHLPADLAAFSKPICELARRMVVELPMNAELVAGLRLMLQAKDCFVRARIPR